MKLLLYLLYTVIHVIYTVSQKRIPDINDCNLKKEYQILIIFGTSIPDPIGHSMAIHVFKSPSVCSCTTWGNQNERNITLLFKVVWLFN